MSINIMKNINYKDIDVFNGLMKQYYHDYVKETTIKKIRDILTTLIIVKKVIQYHDKIYYRDNNNIISDYDYDMLLREYNKLLIKMKIFNHISEYIYKDLEHGVGW